MPQGAENQACILATLALCCSTASFSEDQLLTSPLPCAAPHVCVWQLMATNTQHAAKVSLTVFEQLHVKVAHDDESSCMQQ